MKGDRVEIVVAADDGSRTYEITATRAGRRVETTTARGVVDTRPVVFLLTLTLFFLFLAVRIVESRHWK